MFIPIHFNLLNLITLGLEVKYKQVSAERNWLTVGIIILVVIYCVVSLKAILLHIYSVYKISCKSLKYIPTIYFLRINALKQFLKKRLNI